MNVNSITNTNKMLIYCFFFILFGHFNRNEMRVLVMYMCILLTELTKISEFKS